MSTFLAILAALGWWAWWTEVRFHARESAARDLRQPRRLSDTPRMRRAMDWRPR